MMKIYLVCIVTYQLGRDKEKHIYKVIGRFKSNCYKDIPAMAGEPYIHKEMEEVVNVIHCGVNEEEVERFRLKDVELVEKCKKCDKLRKNS